MTPVTLRVQKLGIIFFARTPDLVRGSCVCLRAYDEPRSRACSFLFLLSGRVIKSFPLTMAEPSLGPSSGRGQPRDQQRLLSIKTHRFAILRRIRPAIWNAW